jgi:cytochrome c
MPAHPDLKVEQAREIVRWILRNNDDADENYLAGIQGAFRTKEKPVRDSRGVYVLTASYTDHGIKEAQHVDGSVRRGTKVGQQSIVLKNID